MQYFDYDKDPTYQETSRYSMIPPPNLQPMQSHRDKRSDGFGDRPSRRDEQRSRPYPSHRTEQSHREQDMRTQSGRGQDMRTMPPPTRLPPRPTGVYRIDKIIPHQQTVAWQECPMECKEWTREAWKLLVDKTRPIDYQLYAQPKSIQQLFQLKNQLSDIPKPEFDRARMRSNPYELIDKSIFINRAAVKLANINSVAQVNQLKPGSDGIFRFADICSGPGGFTEYLLWDAYQKQQRIQGWGMTLKGVEDYTLDAFPPVLRVHDHFVAHYGQDGTGNITVEANRTSFVQMIMDDTGDAGVDLVLGDGAFCVDGDELHQEVHMKQIMLCQVILMLRLLKQGGDFVMKLFDVHTEFTVEILYLLYRHFKNVALLKPLASRPANAEKYVICKDLQLPQPKALIEYLDQVSQQLDQFSIKHGKTVSAHRTPPTGMASHQEKVELELLDVMAFLDPIKSGLNEDEDFLDWIRGHNMMATKKQIEAVQELIKYAQEPHTPTFDQVSMKDKCLAEWGLPLQS